MENEYGCTMCGRKFYMYNQELRDEIEPYEAIKTDPILPLCDKCIKKVVEFYNDGSVYIKGLSDLN